MTAPSEARVIAGVLAARGRLEATLTAEDVLAAARELIDPSTVWTPVIVTPERAEVDRYRQAAETAPAEWVVPDDVVTDALSDALASAWQVVDELAGRRAFGPPVLRFLVHSFDDAIALRSLGSVRGVSITSFLPQPLGPWRWRWPLRVGVVAGPLAEARCTAMRGSGEFVEQYEVRVVAADEPAEVDVLVVDEAESLAAALPGVVFVIGDDVDPNDTAAMDRRARSAEPWEAGAIVALPGRDLDWFEQFIRELSHDRPLDAAIGLVRPDALTVGDPRLFAVTAVRNWSFAAADVNDRRAGPAEISRQLRQIAAEQAFDSERRGGRSTGAAVTAAEAAGATTIQVLGHVTQRAVAADDEEQDQHEDQREDQHDDQREDQREDQQQDPGEEQQQDPEEEQLRPPRRADDRRLFARITGPDGVERRDGFVAGAASTIVVRIAKQVANAVRADQVLDSPTPGQPVELELLFQVGGSRARPQRRALTLPASGPSEWTAPVAVRPPKQRGEITVYVTVLWQGRAIQSLTLTGPVLAPGTPVGAPVMRLSVDVSSAPADEPQHRAADATFVIVPAGARPAVYDAASNVPISAADLDRANRGLRKTLIDTFLRPPADLAGAARPLAELAVRGSLLRDALRGKDTEFYDDATWIHITSFAAAQVPFELIYTHPLPDLDSATVCAPALAGERECAAGCADRDRTDRVCPFAFWGTTKIIERRQHSDARATATQASQRAVSVRAGSVVAVTPKANADDPHAAQRIATAVATFADTGTSIVADTWRDLASAVVQPRNLVCLVTHTIEAADPEDDLGTALELGAERKTLVSIDRRYINPSLRQPGPIVLALGCDTAALHASYASFVSRLHSLGAEIVVSAISQIPGKEVADFVERLLATLTRLLGQPGEKRFGAVMTAARRETLVRGDVIALALIASGDGDVRLESR